VAGSFVECVQVAFEAGDDVVVACGVVVPAALVSVVSLERTSASWSARAERNSVPGVKLSHCSQMFE
jgi:hypothetical protein